MSDRLKPKPRGLGPAYARQVDDASVVAAYGARPPYPERLISTIVELGGGSRARVLDLGCGTGEVTRRLAPRVAAITAVDQSPRMLARARREPGGDAANVVWAAGAVEEVVLSGPFDVAVAAESFHWFDWNRICPRLAALVPSGLVVLVEGRSEEPTPWTSGLKALIARYSTNREFEPYSLIDELSGRGHLAVRGRERLGPEPFQQSVDDYVTCLHSRNGLSTERLASGDVAGFDTAVRALVSPHSRNGVLELMISTAVTWGVVPTGAGGAEAAPARG
jgi:SAM-dependent methyltransferase